jgi:hypothetical protein
MDSFVHRENIAHYRRLLAETNAPADRGRHKMLVRLLADEIAKGAVTLNAPLTTKCGSEEQ